MERRLLSISVYYSIEIPKEGLTWHFGENTAKPDMNLCGRLSLLGKEIIGNFLLLNSKTTHKNALCSVGL